MTFTDDNLKRLKEAVANTSNVEDVYKGRRNILCHDEMEALIARLEAAERVCLQAIVGQKTGYYLLDGAVEAWRKAAGK